MRYAELVPVEVGSPEWHAARDRGMTASRMPVALGLAPWGSTYTLFREMTGELPPQADTEAMAWGRELESVILRRFAREHPELYVTPGALFRNRERPWQMATPDGLAFEGSAPVREEIVDRDPLASVQVKMAATRDGWGDEGTDEVPVYYRAQVLWEMDTLGCETAYFAVLFGGNTYREYVVSYDVEDVAVMRKCAGEFLDRLDMYDPPPVDWRPATTRALKALHPTVDDADADVPADAVRLYRLFREAESEAKRGKAQAENEIRQALGTAARGICDGERVVSRSVFDRPAFDAKALRADHPSLAEQYQTTSTVDRLNVTKGEAK